MFLARFLALKNEYLVNYSFVYFFSDALGTISKEWLKK